MSFFTRVGTVSAMPTISTSGTNGGRPVSAGIVLVVLSALVASLLNGGVAHAAPPSPDRPLSPDIDIIDEYQGQTLCDPTPKPGTTALRQLLWRTYGSSIWAGISRDCDASWDRGISEHKDGRAIDWGVSVRASSKAIGDEFAQWATANNGEMARRSGIMYIIWDSMMWRTYDQDRGWTDYRSCSTRYTSPSYDTTCHRDHMHISMTWHGAGADTSWYDGTPVLRPACDASKSPKPMDPGSAAVSSVLFEPLQGIGTSSSCYLGDGIRAIKVGETSPGKRLLQRLRVERVGLNAPSEVRIWSSVDKIVLKQGTAVPADYELQVGPDGVVYFQAKVGQSQIRVLGLGLSQFVPAGSIVEVPVGGRDGVPADAKAASLNVTATQPRSGGFLRVYPCGGDMPDTSTVNYNSGDTVANSVVVGLNAGKACVYTTSDVNVVVDVVGYFPAGAGLQPQKPVRLTDTRTKARIEADREIAVTLPAGAAAGALNLTVTEPAKAGWVAVVPCGGPRPQTSVVNFVAGQTVANGVLASPGPDGRVCVYASVPTHVVVDLNAVVPTGAGLTQIAPVRLADSRRVPGSRIPALQDFRVQLPAGTSTAVINLTSTESQSGGWALAYPCGVARPATSSVNFAAGQTISNGATVKAGDGGEICLTSSAPAHLIADITAGLSPALFQPVGQARLLDTRLR